MSIGIKASVKYRTFTSTYMTTTWYYEKHIGIVESILVL